MNNNMEPKITVSMMEKKSRQNYWTNDTLKYQSAGEIEKRIAKLAAAYTPEWNFNRGEPDIGGTIARIFAKQMEGNISRYYQVLDKYHGEFINMLGISLLPSKPAHCAVALHLAEDTIPGLKLYKGTKFLAESGEEEPQLVFEAQHNLYLTNSTIQTIFMTEDESGKIVPLLGKLSPPSYLPAKEGEEPGEAGEEEKQLQPFTLFHSKKEGIEKNVLLLYHSRALDVENNDIFLKVEGNEALVTKLEEGSIRLCYYTKEGVRPVEALELMEDKKTFLVRKEEKNEKITIGNKEYSLFLLVAEEPIKENYSIDRIAVSSRGEAVLAEGISNAATDFDKERFDIFTDTLSLYQECYIGHENYFSKAGAAISLTFHVSFLENRINVHQWQQEENLKVIKRKPPASFVEVYADVYPEEISLEYFNGIGWKRLDCEARYERIFSEGKPGDYEIRFICPEDWQPSQAGAYYGKCIRIQLLKATNCYMRPAVHFYPRIENLRISYSYRDIFMEPEYLEAVTGTTKIDLTAQMKAGKPFCVFSRGEYHRDGLYLGFDKKIESGPVSIFFKLRKELPFATVKYKYEYSTIKGFKQMKVMDYTRNISCTGVVLFMPPPDMNKTKLEGKTAYWIRITPMNEKEGLWEQRSPVIENIMLNVAMVANIETREEEEFYLDESEPGLSVPLGVPDILDLELWVNELGQMSRYQMLQLEKENPEAVKIQYDPMGEILSCFVKWQETALLNSQADKRSYVLDRFNSTLHFGDGIHTELPRVLNDVSFKVRIRCCQGQKGNVEVGTITESMENLMFVNHISNPIRGFGGSSMETVEQALKRGSNLLRSRDRLVSTKDYMEEIITYSDCIDKVKCITRCTITGEADDKAVNFVLLLKDFKEGTHSFYKLADEIKEKLMENCEITILEKDLQIVEPIYVEISVDIWAKTTRADQGFEIQTLFKEALEKFLNPVSSGISPGWEIGVIPLKSQIALQMHAVKKEAVIKKMIVTAIYTDHLGRHEVDLQDLKVSPFMVCCSGEHRVHVTYL